MPAQVEDVRGQSSDVGVGAFSGSGDCGCPRDAPRTTAAAALELSTALPRGGGSPLAAPTGGLTRQTLKQAASWKDRALRQDHSGLGSRTRLFGQNFLTIVLLKSLIHFLGILRFPLYRNLRGTEVSGCSEAPLCFLQKQFPDVWIFTSS